MHEDNDLKALLIKGGIEKTSPAFTNNLMRRIERIKYINEPLISKKWIRVYRFTLLSVLGLLVSVSLLITISSLSFTISLQLPEIYMEYSNTIMIYIIAFWALIFLGRKLNIKTKKLF